GATTGLLNGKRDAANLGADYTYTAAGRLKTRKWARGAWTRYDYGQGYLTATRYFTAATTAANVLSLSVGNDTVTPDVVTTYEPLGRPATITQTNQSQIIYAYDPANLTLDTETVKYDIDRNGVYEFTRVLDRSRDSLLRDSGFQLKDGTTIENQASYTYSPTDGRLSSVGSADVPPTPFPTPTLPIPIFSPFQIVHFRSSDKMCESFLPISMVLNS
ncbi:MAG: hypothetical protein HC767_02580, partial [Akkermansiaceae bacterium]|nr:hypothetical protein [Akkermansiaceae bacterium]